VTDAEFDQKLLEVMERTTREVVEKAERERAEAQQAAAATATAEIEEFYERVGLPGLRGKPLAPEVVKAWRG